MLIFNFQVLFLASTLLCLSVKADETIKHNDKVFLKKIVLVGNSVFSEEDLKSYLGIEGKQVDTEELTALAELITDFYVQQGFIASGAYLPEQDVSNGVVRIEIIEGELEQINFNGLKSIRKSYINSRLQSVLSKPLNINELNEQLELLKQNSAIKNLKAELVKGIKLGNSVLVVEVEENFPFQIKTEANNYRSPGVGEFQGTLEATYQNLAGYSDLLQGTYNFTEGFNAYSIGYQIPTFIKNGLLSFEYRDGDSEIIENFEDIDIRAESDSWLLRYNQPIIQKLNNKIALGVEFERQRSTTFILDDLPFSFADGPQDGESVVSTLRFTSDWNKRFQTSALAISSELNFGLDAFGATVNRNAPDGLFFSWLGQSQWMKALNKDKDLLLITRITTQLSPDPLLPLKQFTLGGQGTVRGVRQNQEIGDNGVVGTIEFSVPLIGNDRENSSRIKIIPFFDFGKVWSNNNSDTSYLASVGVGANWKIEDYLSLTLDWGVPLINNDDSGNSLQENGLTFSLEVDPL